MRTEAGWRQRQEKGTKNGVCNIRHGRLPRTLCVHTQRLPVPLHKAFFNKDSATCSHKWGESHRITVLQLYGTGTQALSNLLARTSTPRSRAPMEFREQPKDSPGPVPRIRNIFFYTVLPKIPRVEESCPHVTARQHQECTWQHPPTTDMKQAARNPTPASSEWALAFSTPAIQLDTITNISPLPGERPAWKSFV